MKITQPALSIFASLAFTLGAASVAQAQTPAPSAEKRRVDIEAVQGVLAVRSLDGWLMYASKGQNPIATELVAPDGTPTRQWFYFIPAFGQPGLLVHKSEASAFVKVPGRKIEYAGYRDLKEGLRTLLKGSSRVAMEYAPKSGIPSLTRVDAGTVNLVRKAGVSIESSADLVQFTKSLWGPDGRIAHYVAAHHLTKLRDEAFDFVAKKILAGEAVSEADVQDFLAAAYRVRGLKGSVRVAVGANTAKPAYKARSKRSKAIREGQLLMLYLNGADADAERGIYASLSWVGYVGKTVPERHHRAFKVVAEARDAAITLIEDRVKRRRPVKGFEADQQARSVVGKAGLASRFVHRTGHSLDTSLHGDGANLDDYETHDTRALVVGSGFTIGPGVYMPTDFGLRSVVNVHIAREGVEVTTQVQKRITPILLQ